MLDRMSSATAPDGWWESQPIARAQAEGYTHLSIRCSCGRSSDMPWGLFRHRPEGLIGELLPRLRCTQCDRRGVQLLGVWRIEDDRDDRGFARPGAMGRPPSALIPK
jgi:hypothetical protein